MRNLLTKGEQQITCNFRVRWGAEPTSNKIHWLKLPKICEWKMTLMSYVFPSSRIIWLPGHSWASCSSGGWDNLKWVLCSSYNRNTCFKRFWNKKIKQTYQIQLSVSRLTSLLLCCLFCLLFAVKEFNVCGVTLFQKFISSKVFKVSNCLFQYWLLAYYLSLPNNTVRKSSKRFQTKQITFKVRGKISWN